MFLLERNEKDRDKEIVTSYFLEKILERRSKLNIEEKYKLSDNICINIAYPNLGILSENKEKCVVFHHGHFVESKYYIMSKLKADLLDIDCEMPSDIQLIESENFAWIDFLWSALGRSGEVGALTETLYEHMLDERQMNVLISKVAKNLAKKYDLIGWPDLMEEKILKSSLELIFSRISEGERNLKDIPLGQQTEKGMTQYLMAVRNQIINERRGAPLPSELAFVFGHTHKPFLEEFNIDGFKMPVAVYNTGGWVVDKVKREDVFGGAVLLMDEDLDACLLEMYREYDGPESHRVGVRHLHEGTTQSPFYKRIINLVHSEEKPWLQFSNIAHLDVKNRADRLDVRIKNL
jgi:hypothetical protein